MWHNLRPVRLLCALFCLLELLWSFVANHAAPKLSCGFPKKHIFIPFILNECHSLRRFRQVLLSLRTQSNQYFQRVRTQPHENVPAQVTENATLFSGIELNESFPLSDETFPSFHKFQLTPSKDCRDFDLARS